VATSAAAYSFAGGTAVGARPRSGSGGAGYGWSAAAVGKSAKAATAAAVYTWLTGPTIGENGENWPDDRFRVIVQEARSKEILSYDLNVTNLMVQRALSGACDIAFDVNPADDSVDGIYFKPWKHYIHLEKAMQGKRKIWATAIVQPSELDQESGVLHLKARGFAAYPKGLPWLQDLNWIANDAYEPIHEIWRHLQEDFPNGDLDVEVFPKRSGIIMLPGYAYDGSSMSLNFFATFVRAADKLDCGDFIDALARTIPFDYAERSQWNADRTDVIKKIELGSPRLGVVQDHLAFVIGENVLTAKAHTESQIDWISDIGVSGFFPGFEYSYELANADPTRLRRYLNEADADIDSNERAAAWARRKLARRQTPAYWETITIDMEHPNAPFGTFDVGDTITVSGPMPWVGEISQDHKIIAIGVDDTKNVCQLTLKAEGAFNYDPIFFPDGETNVIGNGTFDFNLNGWSATGPGWSHDAGQGNSRLGCATITADGGSHDLLTQAYGVSRFQIFPLEVAVKISGAVGDPGAVQLVAQFYDEDNTPTQAVLVDKAAASMGSAWQALKGNVLTPVGSEKVAMRLRVGAGLLEGQVRFDDAEITL